MAIYHCSIKNISRRNGRSAVASSAYRSGQKLTDEETGMTHDYTRKRGIVFSEIILCKNAPKEYADRAILWNEVQKVEKASDARLAREWEVAIPNELTLEQGKKLVHGFAQSLADEGMCVDMAIHWKEGNHHAHIMGTTRQIKGNGEWASKEKKAYKLDGDGKKIPIIDQQTGEQKIGRNGRKLWQRETIQANDWNKTEKVEDWRKRWAAGCNQYLSLERHIDHRSLERQGKEQIPTIHEGYAARKIEQKGGTAERCQVNRDIKAANQELAALQQQEILLTVERNRFVMLLQQVKEKAKEELNERLRRLRAARAANEPTGGNAAGNRTIPTDCQTAETEYKPASGRSIEERLAAFQSARRSGRITETDGKLPSPETTDTETLVREARAGIRSATSKEEDSRAGRTDRETERGRFDTEGEPMVGNRKTKRITGNGKHGFKR